MITYSNTTLAGHRLFVAEEDSVRVGWLSAIPRQLPYGQATIGRHYVEIRDLFVEEPYRRRGIGAALVHEAFDWALGNGFTHVNVEVSAHQDGVQEFWEDIGFEARSIMYDIALE